MKFSLAVALFAAVAVSVAHGQAAPAGTISPGAGIVAGPVFPAIDGVFHYSLTGSELMQTGYRGSGPGFSTTFSGAAAYSTTNVVRPFSMVYSGGLFLGNQYGQAVRTFQNFSISQGLTRGQWIFGISDSVSYLPQSPTTGLSGIPGIGDLGSPVQGPSTGPAGGVLTNNATNVSNALSGNIARRITPLTSISGMGGWTILRYPSGEGLDNSQISAQVALNHQIDARDTVGGNFSYSNFSYGSGIALTVQTRGVNGVFSRLLSRSLSASISAGPMWITGSNSALVPSRLTVASDISLNYTRKFTNAALSYSRGVNGGSGVQPGALSDNVTASVGRTYGRDWMASVSANYTHTSGLVQGPAASLLPSGYPFSYAGGNINMVFGGVQVTRRLSESLSAYGSYNLQHQSIGSSLAAQNAYSGFTQTIGVGISYSPRSRRLGQF